MSWELFTDAGQSLSKSFVLQIPLDICCGMCLWHLDMYFVVLKLSNKFTRNHSLSVNVTSYFCVIYYLIPIGISYNCCGSCFSINLKKKNVK